MMDSISRTNGDRQTKSAVFVCVSRITIAQPRLECTTTLRRRGLRVGQRARCAQIGPWLPSRVFERAPAQLLRCRQPHSTARGWDTPTRDADRADRGTCSRHRRATSRCAGCNPQGESAGPPGAAAGLPTAPVWSSPGSRPASVATARHGPHTHARTCPCSPPTSSSYRWHPRRRTARRDPFGDATPPPPTAQHPSYADRAARSRGDATGW
mmetsp:Transcript_19754/g.50282  ORF Transcript_19754/g.50282 Transcript_19754/m.50282 type:complete len:211 (-) Transcript_19754:552-1184(-)